jgi:hypothetical protein
VTLSVREIDELQSALKRKPSPEFILAFRYILSAFHGHRKAVTSATAAAVQNRISAVVDSAKILQKSMSDLEVTDALHLNKIISDRLWDERRAGLNELADKLALFLPMAEEALEAIAKEPKQGVMPAIAERALARDLCQIIFEETGEVPTAKKGDRFDRVLRFALDYHSGRKPRKDVADLMRSALKEKPTKRYLLSLLSTGKWQRGAAGTNRPN